MINDIVQFSNFLKCLKEAHCLGNVILVGSWSEYLYQTFISDFTAEMATIDLDFLVPDLNKPEEKSKISEIAKQYGFEYSEKGDPAYSIFTGKDGFEVEFLSELKGDGINKNSFSNMGVKTQQLRHLNLLQDFTRFATFNHLTVRVPEPEAYCLQKMIINADRLGQGKFTSDQKKISNIIPYLNPSIVAIIYDSLTEKEKNRVNSYIKSYLDKQDIYEMFNIEKTNGFVASTTFDSGIQDVAFLMRATKRNEAKIYIANNESEIEKVLAESTRLRSQIAEKLEWLLASTDKKEEAKTYIYMKLSKQGIHSPENVIDGILDSIHRTEKEKSTDILKQDDDEPEPSDSTDEYDM